MSQFPVSGLVVNSCWPNILVQTTPADGTPQSSAVDEQGTLVKVPARRGSFFCELLANAALIAIITKGRNTDNCFFIYFDI